MFRTGCFYTRLALASHKTDLSLTIRLQGAALGRGHFAKRPLLAKYSFF